jgi:AcrR family transcriptional regulator
MQARPASIDESHSPKRLSKAARRNQLLDSAADLITQRGIDGVTMEGVAALAEVSKALPYLHFANAEALIMALREREMDRWTREVAASVGNVDGFEEKIAVIIHVGFDMLKERGTLFLSLLWAPDTNRKLGEQPKPRLTRSDWMLADLFEAELRLARQDARIAQRTLAVGLVGAYEAWAEGIASQRANERVHLRHNVDGARARAAAPDGRAPRASRASNGRAPRA